MTAAPRDTASRTNALPSSFAPCNAKKSARGLTFRESHAICRISRFSVAEGTLASAPANNSRSFNLRGETRVGDASCRPSSAWFVLELLVSSTLNPVLILIPDSRVRLRFLLDRCPELHRDFRAVPHFGTRRRRLLCCKIAANQHRLKAQLQSNVRHVAHRLPAEVGYFNVAALIHRDGQNRLRGSGLLPRIGLGYLGCRGRRIG